MSCVERLANGAFAAGEATEARVADYDVVRAEMPLMRHPGKLGDLPDAPGVYFVQLDQGDGEGPIKIGMSSVSLRSRVAEFDGGYPWRVVPLGWAPGGAKEEQAAHFAMRKHRMNGEWFRPHADVFAFIGRCRDNPIRRAVVEPKKQVSVFDIKAYESWVRGESPDDACPVLAARKPHRLHFFSVAPTPRLAT
jgi:hypothetical protein